MTLSDIINRGLGVQDHLYWYLPNPKENGVVLTGLGRFPPGVADVVKGQYEHALGLNAYWSDELYAYVIRGVINDDSDGTTISVTIRVDDTASPIATAENHRPGK